MFYKTNKCSENRTLEKMMRFHDILEDIFSSKVKISVVKILFRYPEKKFSGRELARVVNASPSRVWEILNFLQRYGIIESARIGNTIAWNLNKSSIFSKELSKVFHLEKKMFRDLKHKITHLFKKRLFVKRVILFGSVAHGKESPESDIDLLIVVKKENDKKIARDIIQQLNPVFLSLYGNMISEIIYSEKEWLAKRNTPLAKNIESNGEVLFEREAA